MYARIINEYPNTHTAEQAKYYSLNFYTNKVLKSSFIN